jgi:hypothetical protein
MTDEKVGQLISLQRGQAPSDPNNRRLRFRHFGVLGAAALMNVNFEAAVWRWIAGFHSALYREPLRARRRCIVTPFTRANQINGTYSFLPIPVQHLLFVKMVKVNRIRNSVDRIVTNKGKMTYECLWVQTDDRSEWFCMFALNIYDWKDLGATSIQPARGCAGGYALDTGQVPSLAARGSPPLVWIPDPHPLDPFA